MQYILDINYHLNVNLRLSMYTTDMYNIIFFGKSLEYKYYNLCILYTCILYTDVSVHCNKLGNII